MSVVITYFIIIFQILYHVMLLKKKKLIGPLTPTCLRAAEGLSPCGEWLMCSSSLMRRCFIYMYAVLYAPLTTGYGR